ncbi:HD domain-containing protein [Bacillus cereus]|uniref:HD domain-containing protein n=1 Tax=Bacillus cereus TaxID=1396 RepID=UPI0014839BC6|nr:HD domain-containing protein [Bacillus cereus]
MFTLDIAIETLSSRTKHLFKELKRLNYPNAIRALKLVIQEMCAEKGYKRHNGVHYYYHLVDVTQILINARIKENKDENLLIASLLHDIVEDVPGYTIEKISEMFNPRVAEIVDKLSKKKGVDYTKQENIKIYLTAILEDEDATFIKTADRMNNFATLRYAPFKKKIRQARETQKHYIPFFKEARNKYEEHSTFFFSAKTYVEPLLWEIQAHHDTYREKQKLEKVLLKVRKILEKVMLNFKK